MLNVKKKFSRSDTGFYLNLVPTSRAEPGAAHFDMSQRQPLGKC